MNTHAETEWTEGLWQRMLAGKFIVLDGGEGTGKSTAADRLEGELEQAGQPTLRVREPGGTLYGEQIRHLLLRWVPESPETLDPMTEVLLFAAARNQLLVNRILPALRESYCVIADRFVTSSFAYQGSAGDVDMARIMTINKATIPVGQWPWLTIILDCPHEVAVARMQAAGTHPDRIEAQGDAYHKKVRQGFRDMPDVLSDVNVIDASGSEDDTWNAIVALIQGKLR